MIPAATIPAFEPGIGTQLHHAMRQYGTGVGMTVASGSDKRIHIFCIILLSQEVKGEKEKERGGEDEFIFHVNRFVQDNMN